MLYMVTLGVYILMVNITIYSIHGSYGYGVVLSNILGIIIIYYGNSYYPTSTQGRHKQALAATDQMYNRGMFNGHFWSASEILNT